MKNILVTGGAGFIGSAFARHMVAQHPELNIIVLDLLTYAGNLNNLASVSDEPNYRFNQGDIASREDVSRALQEFRVDTIVNFAAESHVDRSILAPDAFIHSNTVGVHVLLDEACRAGVGRFLQVSTDEVYGDVAPGCFSTEGDNFLPNSPYAASKASAELLVRASHITHGLDTVITRGSNTFGPFQYPEKLMPFFITEAIDGRPLPLYGDGLQQRDWLHVDDHARGIACALFHGVSGQAYNIAGEHQAHNIDVTRLILESLGQPATCRTARGTISAMPCVASESRAWAGNANTTLKTPPPLPYAGIRKTSGGGALSRPATGTTGTAGSMQPVWRLLTAERTHPAAARPCYNSRECDGRAMRILVTGAAGNLGKRLLKDLAEAGHEALGADIVGDDVERLDICDFAATQALVRRLEPDLVIHAAAWTDVDGCARDPERALAINGFGSQHVALAAAATGSAIVYVSSNEVFSGRDRRPLDEFARPAPCNPYGYSKLAGEVAVAAHNPRHYIVRSAWLFAHGGRNFVQAILGAARAGRQLRVVSNEVANPTYTNDLSEAIVRLVASERFGTYHFVNEGACSRLQFARYVLDRAGFADTAIQAISSHQWPRPGSPPEYAALANHAGRMPGITLRPWREAVDAFLRCEGLLR